MPGYLDEVKVPAGSLTLEITESVLLDDAETAIATVRAVSSEVAGKHEFSVEATQADGQKVVAYLG